jgi:hypothetical protein
MIYGYIYIYINIHTIHIKHIYTYLTYLDIVMLDIHIMNFHTTPPRTP